MPRNPKTARPRPDRSGEAAKTVGDPGEGAEKAFLDHLEYTTIERPFPMANTAMRGFFLVLLIVASVVVAAAVKRHWSGNPWFEATAVFLPALVGVGAVVFFPRRRQAFEASDDASVGDALKFMGVEAELSRLRREIASLRGEQSTWTPKTDSSEAAEDADSKPPAERNSRQGQDADSGAPSNMAFSAYHVALADQLSARSTNFERKASITLDTGKRWIGGGLAIYLVGIIVWQWILQVAGSNHEAAFMGMASTSLLLLGIEATGAWYLRQYRRLTEIAGYYVELRLVFDRYLLLYLVSKEAALVGPVNSLDKIRTFLTQPIEWPQQPGDPGIVRSTEAALKVVELARKLAKDASSAPRGE